MTDNSPTAPSPHEGVFVTRGIVLAWDDIVTVDWPRLAQDAGLNTLSVHAGAEVRSSDRWRSFEEDCAARGIVIEQEQHAMAELLPRSLFETSPALFRMTADGERTADYNLCASSSEALDIVARNAVAQAAAQGSTSDRFFFWLDDGGDRCHCPECAPYSPSDQALLVENAIARALRRWRPTAALAHLAYQDTMPAPVDVVPEDNVFLEFAPFYRSWEAPLAERDAYALPVREEDVPARDSRRAVRRDTLRVSHGEYLDHLDANLAVFGAGTAQVLEYWLDVSLFSNWQKPAVELPWHEDVIREDVDCYGSRGIRRITTFGVNLDGDYFARYPGEEPVLAYGRALASWRPR